MTEPKEAQEDRRVPVLMYRMPFERNPGHLESDEQLSWLADQLCSDTRVHPERTMACGFIPYQAAYEFPHLWDRFQSLAAESAALREKLAEIRDVTDIGSDAHKLAVAALTGGDNAEG